MKFTLQPPPVQEAQELKIDEELQTIEFEPALVRGLHVLKIAYLTACGEGGVESKAVVLFNGRTGVFSLHQMGSEPPQLAFDLPKPRFEEKRESARKATSKGRKARKQRSDAQPPPVQPTPTIDSGGDNGDKPTDQDVR